MQTFELKKAIETVIPATAAKGFVEGWDTLIFNDGELLAYNDKICISAVLEDSKGITCAVNAKDMITVVKGFAEGELFLSLEGDKLKMATHSVEVEFATRSSLDSVKKLIDQIAVDLEQFKYLPKDFNDGVKLCFFAVSDDYNDERGLFCMNFNGNCIYGGSNFRVSKFTFERTMEENFLIPKSVIPHLMRFEPVSFQVSDGWVHFLNSSETLFSCRTVDIVYPDVERIISSFNKSHTIELPKQLKKAIDAIVTVLDNVLEIDRVAQISISNGVMVLKAEKEAAVWIKHKIPFDDKTVALEMKINSIFLSEILNLTSTLQIEGYKAKFEAFPFEHLIMLCNE